MSAAAVLAAYGDKSSASAGTEHVRGTIQILDGQGVSVTTSSGLIRVHIAPSTAIAAVTPSDREHIAEGSFLGITSVAQPDGSQRAVEIHVFPESMRGTGEGSHGWGLPRVDGGSSKMTNGTATASKMTTELKCIEGWSVIVTWAGARLSDFATAYNLGTRTVMAPDPHNPRDLVRYVGLGTPDGGYYVGLDMPSALHPQTLLCYEMNGAPLPLEHGGPLRLVTTVKYGIKSLKRIGTITFGDERPADFWAERGYDWYAGL
jgi:hypothetical protein